MVDVARTGAGRKRLIRRVVWIVGGLLAASLLSVAVTRLKPAVPLVEWSSVWPDKVRRGPMLRQVRGIGTLVAEDTLFVPAVTDGRVDRIVTRPGTPVTPETVIVMLSNPELNQAALNAEYDTKMAEARLQDLEVRLDSETLTQKADLARVEAEHTQAKLRLARDEVLFREKLIIELNYQLVKATAEEMEKRIEIERERGRIRERTVVAQLDVQRAEIQKLRALHQLKKEQVEALKVTAGVEGVLQELPVQVGQRLLAGAVIAKVVQPSRLKAELKVPETQAKDVAMGQRAEIDTRNGIVMGTVYRIDPAAREGTVTVDVKLDGKLPPGARPDLSVDGNIEVERLANVMFVGRPASSQPEASATLFRVEPDGKFAQRIPVRYGKASTNTIEIRQGLNLGDQVILSDMSAVDGQDRIQLK